MQIFPFQDGTVILEATGKTLRETLENGVSQYPAHDGRFPQISGMRFVFDPSRPPYDRVVSVTIGEDHVPLDLEKTYKLVTRAFMHQGHDGYGCLSDAKVLMEEELGSPLSTVMLLAFKEANVVASWKRRFNFLATAIAAFKGVKKVGTVDFDSRENL